MLHTDVLRIYRMMFPQNADAIDLWYQNGYNSVRIRFFDRKELVFTFNNIEDWKLETLDSFMKTMNKK